MKKQNISQREALDRLRLLLSKSEKCRFDVRKKLAGWNLEDQSDSIIEILEEEGFLNEERYTHAFVNDKVKLQKWGKKKVDYYLRSRGVEEAFIRAATEALDPEEYSHMVRLELKKKLDSLKITDRYQQRQKLYAFGSQRGYDFDLMNKHLDEWL